MKHKIMKFLNMVNPFYYWGKRKTAQLEQEIWGNFERGDADFIKVEYVNTVNHSNYQITRPQHLEFVREYLSSQKISRNDKILDIGCGKGGMLCAFSEFKFGKIAGLEFLEELCMVARENMRKINVNAEIIHADAITYDAYDTYNYFYMYNPFNEEILQKVIQFIDKSLTRVPREIHVIYCNPVYGDMLIRAGYKIEKRFRKTLFFTEDAIVYFKHAD